MTEEEKKTLKELKFIQDVKAILAMVAIGIVALAWLYVSVVESL